MSPGNATDELHFNEFMLSLFQRNSSHDNKKV